MTNLPLISIIVPVYNTENYISDCLQSLIRQTEKNIEILAVDDGSTDSSLQILQQYEASYPQIKVFTQKNKGPGEARNLALKQAQGKYIMFCDSDDMYKPTMCQEMTQIMENENVDFAYCDTEEYEAKKQKSHILQKGLQNISPNDFPEIAVGIWCFIFRNDILKKYKINFPPCFYAEDFAFAMKYIFISNTAFALDKKLYILRARADSLMHSLSLNSNNLKFIDNMDAIKDMYEFLQSHKMWTYYKKRYLKVVEKLSIFCFQNLTSDNKARAFKKLEKIMQPLQDDLENFTILSLAAKGKEKDFKKYLKNINISGTKKIKILGLTIYKVKNKIDEQIHYFLGMQIYKTISFGSKKHRYVLGVRIS